MLCAMCETDPAPLRLLREVIPQVQDDENVTTWVRQVPNFLDVHVKSLQGAEGAQRLTGYARWEAMRGVASNVRRTFMPLFDPLAPIFQEFGGHMTEARRIEELVEQLLKAAGRHISFYSVIASTP